MQADAVLAGAGAVQRERARAPAASLSSSAISRSSGSFGSTQVARSGSCRRRRGRRGSGAGPLASASVEPSPAGSRPGARSARRCRWRSRVGSPASAAWRRSRRCAAPSRAACAPRAWSPTAKAFAAVLGGDLLHRRGLLLDAGRRCRGTPSAASALRASASLRVRVDRAHRVAVEQLAARDRHAHLDDLDRRPHRRVDARERADRRRHRLGQRIQPQRDLGDHAQRAFAADEQARQVVAGADDFLRARAGADDLAAAP